MLVNPHSTQIKLIDFGLARRYKKGDSLKVLFGTPEFMAPEVINYDQVTTATDMWSIGVITYVLLSGLSPFAGDNDSETLTNVTSGEWDFDDPVFEDISDEAKDFITELLVMKARDRATVKDCLDHPWFMVSKTLSNPSLNFPHPIFGCHDITPRNSIIRGVTHNLLMSVNNCQYLIFHYLKMRVLITL